MGRKCIFITYSSIKIYTPLCKCVYMMYTLLPIALSTPGLLHYVCDSHIVLHMMKLTSCLSLKPRCSPTPTVVNVVEYFCGWCSMKWLVSHTLDIKIKSCYRPIWVPEMHIHWHSIRQHLSGKLPNGVDNKDTHFEKIQYFLLFLWLTCLGRLEGQKKGMLSCTEHLCSGSLPRWFTCSISCDMTLAHLH